MKKVTCLILLFSLSYLVVFAQTNFYVSPSGDDDNTGTLAAPWKTFQKACNSATPGSTVHLRAGTYAEGWLNVSGTVGNYITFKNYNEEVAIIDGGSDGTGTVLMGISNKSYIRVEGLDFRNATGNFSAGIYIVQGSSHLEIIDNKISNVHFSNDVNATVTSNTNVNPFVVYNENPTQACTNILVQGNEIFDCRTGFSEALTLSGNVDGFEISGNTVHDITNIGIDIAGGYGVSSNPANDFARNGVVKANTTYNCVSAYAVSAGIYVDGGQNVVVERNTSYQNGRGFEIGCEQKNHETTNIIVRNNLSYNNRETGIGIGGYNYPSETGKVTNSQILNNTFYNNNTTNKDFEGELLIEYTENCTIENNIFHATNINRFLIVARLNSQNIGLNYNLFYHPDGTSTTKVDWEGSVYTGFSAYQNGANQDANSSFGDPLFTNTNTPDFSIINTSPAKDAGNPNFVLGAGETDYIGQSRIQNTRVDIGALEVQVGSCPSSLNLSGSITAGTYATSSTLTATGTIAGSSTVRFEATNINLGTNFHAPAGSNFTAVISPCSSLITEVESMNFKQKILPNLELLSESNINFKVFPNPFDQSSTIQYTLPKTNKVSLILYTIGGQEIRKIKPSSIQPKGNYEIDLSRQNLPTGLYLLKAQTSHFQKTIKISIVQ